VHTRAEFLTLQTETSVAVVIPRGGLRLTRQGSSAPIKSMTGALMAGGMASG
jgi:hypothetical protein